MKLLETAGDAFARMNPRNRRALTMGAVVLAPFVLFFGVVKPYRESMSELHDRTVSERALLAREEGIIAMGPSLPRLASAAGERAKRADMRLVRGANRALEEAELTAYLERTASFSRVLLQESRGVEPPRGADTTGVVRPIRLAVRGESDLKGVLTFVQRIEASPLLMHIAELSMEPVLTKTSSDTQDGVIKFALVLEAYAPSSQTTDAPNRSPEVIQ
jgi:hypothetical protein